MAEAKFDIKTEATRPFFATVGATDLAVEVARQYVADVQARVTAAQKKVAAYEFDSKVLNAQAQSFAKSRVDLATKEAKDRQAKLEAKLNEFQTDAKALPAKAQSFLTDYVNDVTETYADLVKRGEKAVAKLRKAEVKVDVEPKATKTTVTAEAKSTATKKAPAKTTAKKAPAKKAAKKA